MRQQRCEQCQQEFPLRELFRVRDRTLCAPCGDKYLKEPGVKILKSEIRRLNDPTVCSVCGKDGGAHEWGLLGKLPACDECVAKLRHRPFPLWLRASLAGLLVLLVISLVHGIGYFKAEAALVRGQRFLDQGNYAEAASQFAEVLQVAPDCKTALLLSIKADIFSDDFKGAAQGIDRTKGMQFEGDLINEINALLDRSGQSLQANAKAASLANAGKEAEALPLAKQAHELLPESRLMNINYLGVAAGVDFDQKDYDGFLQNTETMVKLMPQSSRSQSLLASALAAKYASTGDEKFHQLSLAALASAKDLGHTAQEQTDYAEYSERILYRLNTKDIIDKAEYDRRFRTPKP